VESGPGLSSTVRRDPKAITQANYPAHETRAPILGMDEYANTPPGSNGSAPADVCLLLRAHAEARWLSRSVLPVLAELERSRSRPDGEPGAARAYLAALWIEACAHATETDAARVELEDRGASNDPTLCEKARRYHSAARRLREATARRVEPLLAVPATASQRPPTLDRCANR
jgi:hypothetical protein